MSNKRHITIIGRLTGFVSLRSRSIVKPKHVLILILAGLVQTVGWTASETGEPQADSYSYNTYQVISQRNVFSKNRRPPQPPRAVRQQPRIQRSVIVALYVLKGIAANGPQKKAFIENEVSGEFMQAVIGTSLPNGIIKDIQYNYVVYEEDGQTQKVGIGEIFSRSETQVEVSADAPPPAETAPIEGGDQSDILKRMLERRRSQTGS